MGGILLRAAGVCYDPRFPEPVSARHGQALEKDAMPEQTVDKLNTRLEREVKKLGALGEDADAAARRVARKRVKRTQRKRRLTVAAVAKAAGKPKKDAAGS